MDFDIELKFTYKPQKFLGYNEGNIYVYDRVLELRKLGRYVVIDIVEKFQRQYRVDKVNHVVDGNRIIRTYQAGYEHPLKDKITDRSVYLAFRNLESKDYEVIGECLWCIFYEYIFKMNHEDFEESFPEWTMMQDHLLK